jgi:hypothetical protein
VARTPCWRRSTRSWTSSALRSPGTGTHSRTSGRGDRLVT